MKRIPLLIPDLPSTDDLIPYLRRIDAARWYTNFGPLLGELEAKLLGTFEDNKLLHLTSVCSCTLGLELALSALGLTPRARVLIPALTFVATATAVIRAGLTPVVADVDLESWLLSPEIAESALTGLNFECILPVAAFGCPQDVKQWDQFTEKTSIPVVLDAAGAFGNQRAGRWTTQVFSLHATKSLGAGEGGFVLSRDRQYIRRVRQLSNFGIDLPSGLVRATGSNAKLSEYHAAVGLASLSKWNALAEIRRQLAAKYRQLLATICPSVHIQSRPGDGVYTVLAVCMPEEVNVARVASALFEAGIETRRWYYPLINGHPAFQHCAAAGSLANAQKLSGRILGLPFHVFLSAGECEHVCATLAYALAKEG